MLGASDFIAPQNYSWWWSALGILVIVLSAAWLIGVWVFTRPRAARPEPSAPPSVPRVIEPIRATYLRRIDELEASWAARIIGERAAGQQLSTLMREYVDAVSGTTTETMTLTDLQLQRFDGLGHAVAGLYPIAFPERSTGDMAGGFVAARQVVSTWK